MRRNSCGCTAQGPGPECTRGRDLYTTASGAFQALFNGKAMIANDERWSMYSLARLAYLDHLNGWQDGDVKIQRRAGFGMIFTRFNGQWIFQFGTKEDALLVDWLSTRGYQRYVQVKSERPRDQLLGFYRMERTNDQRKMGEMLPVQVQEIADALSLLKRGMTLPPERGSASRTPSSSPIDLKTQVAIRIALLVASITGPLTLANRLSVQQHAARLLQEHGIVVRLSDEQTLQELIDEAAQQKERLKRLLEQSTRPSQS